jgi:predicted glycoside hydrolase/deacetylase ChbG (UPF0249 family)
VSLRLLIVNADDFGQSRGVNRGISRAHECGIVTSASLMVRWPAAQEAADYLREHPQLSVGLHIDLGEWRYTDGRWRPVYHVVDQDDPAAVKAEVQRQLKAFRTLTGREPTHLDSHQHVHLREPADEIVAEIAATLGAPLRGVRSPAEYCGSFYGQTGDGAPLPELITADALIAILASLPEGCTEIGCHPGLDDDVATAYAVERIREVETLCDPRVREAIAAAGIRLCSFHDVRG